MEIRQRSRRDCTRPRAASRMQDFAALHPLLENTIRRQFRPSGRVLTGRAVPSALCTTARPRGFDPPLRRSGVYRHEVWMCDHRHHREGVWPPPPAKWRYEGFTHSAGNPAKWRERVGDSAESIGGGGQPPDTQQGAGLHLISPTLAAAQHPPRHTSALFPFLSPCLFSLPSSSLQFVSLQFVSPYCLAQHTIDDLQLLTHTHS
jgi:hypothetical protein